MTYYPNGSVGEEETVVEEGTGEAGHGLLKPKEKFPRRKVRILITVLT